jgi:hypothetical protein
MAKKENCCTLNVTDVGLAFGLCMGAFHLLWVILVALGIAQAIMDWILGLHFVTMTYAVGTFEFWTALSLVVFTMVVGFVGGVVFAAIWNYFMKKK